MVVFGVLFGTVAGADGPGFSSGGIVRMPNSQQLSDRDNAMLEGWAKVTQPLYTGAFGELSFFLRGKYLADSAGFAFNRSHTAGAGLALKIKPGPKSSLTFSIRHDWYTRRDGSANRSGTRVLIDYFYMDYRVLRDRKRVYGLGQSAHVLKVYGNLTFPDTLQPGDRNVVITAGSEMSRNLSIPDKQVFLSPFAGLALSWDSDGNSYNNKFQQTIGLRVRWPVPGGDVHAGLRYQGDYRWISERFRHGPGLFVGWYVSF